MFYPILSLNYIETAQSNFFDVGKTILVDNNIRIGTLTYAKLPFLKWYILYDFYVRKDFRNKGYGTLLMETVLKKLLLKGARKIFVQPGPFELTYDNLNLDEQKKEERLNKLIKFYARNGFFVINNTVITKGLALLYKVFGIQEDPQFIMMYKSISTSG
jgi:GNAT superfamily N-acetyltransferase